MEAVNTKQTIHAEARRLFSERGYTATSIRDIADAVGIKGASMYSHISGKEELLWNMVMSIAEAFRQRVVPHLETDLPAPIKLRSAIVEHISVITENIESATIYFHEWKFLSEERRTDVLARRDAYEEAFRQVLKHGITNRQFVEIDEKYASIMLLSSMNAIYTWYKPGGAMSAQQLAELYAQQLLSTYIPQNRKKSITKAVSLEIKE
jgi:TetR/AcrR family transcriptional regulator, cholesterol catabolism regulator